MATTAIWNIRGNLSTVLNYAGNKDKTAFDDTELQGLTNVMDYATKDYKTEKRYYVSGINCFSENAREQMLTTKKRYGKTGGNIAYHAYQYFVKGAVTAYIAHEIRLKLAKNLWGDRYE